MIPAVGQDIPVYAATIYAPFPNVVMAPADSGIKTAIPLLNPIRSEPRFVSLLNKMGPNR